jgi:hypothetical protein
VTISPRANEITGLSWFFSYRRDGRRLVQSPRQTELSQEDRVLWQ